MGGSEHLYPDGAWAEQSAFRFVINAGMLFL
ncbi:hypothetical protein QO005_002746 [Rhizobium paknamense]|uniref:Uncharacterized protein n=1 Tax=Rhizobium paknamense TaxID=1206817 RepID=A0ABU0IDS4_9HYPH|nr:hypothetical protein [Rhizobium paknamense]